MSNLKVRIDPIVEFKDDAMMKEIHLNRVKMYEITKRMNTKEKLLFIKEKASRFRKTGKTN